MKQVNFFQKGTILYTMICNILTKLTVYDVYIDIKQEPIVKYKLSKEGSDNFITLGADEVFDSLEGLKMAILKQFDELTPKEVEKCKEETTT